VLSNFAPSGDDAAPTSPDQAVLSVLLDAEYAENPGDPVDGHYLGAESPLPGSMVTFTPTGGKATPATLSNGGDTNGKGNDDDGLFDAIYSFVVPATLTTGTLNIASGSFTGAEYITFTPEQGTTTLDITAPANLSVSSPPVPALAVQKKPPWVGEPVPPTAAAASSSSSTGGHPSGRFPIWLAVVLLAVLAGAVIGIQRGRARSHHVAAATPAATPSGTSGHGVVVTGEVPEPPVELLGTVTSVVTPVRASDLVVNVLGPIEVQGWRQVPDRRIIEELLCYLVLHDRHRTRSSWRCGRPTAFGPRWLARPFTLTCPRCASASGRSICPTPTRPPATG
jgi:hypothetical protein